LPASRFHDIIGSCADDILAAHAPPENPESIRGSPLSISMVFPTASVNCVRGSFRRRWDVHLPRIGRL